MMMMIMMMWRHQGLPANPQAIGRPVGAVETSDPLSLVRGGRPHGSSREGAERRLPPMRPFAPTCANGCCRPEAAVAGWQV
jgi:hypothetical protein